MSEPRTQAGRMLVEKAAWPDDGMTRKTMRERVVAIEDEAAALERERLRLLAAPRFQGDPMDTWTRHDVFKWLTWLLDEPA